MSMKFRIPTKITIRKPKWPKLPKFTLPKLSVPKIELPKVSLPKMPKLPKFSLPSFSVPQVEIPKLSFPQVSFPRLAIPKISMPKLPALPKISLPKVSVPKISLPKLSMPKWSYEFRPSHLRAAVGVVFCLFLFTAFQTGFGQRVGVWAANLKMEEAFMRIARNDAPASEVVPAAALNNIVPAAGDEDGFQSEDDGRYSVEDNTIEVEAVLIPRENTVISSSQDSKIKTINFDNGEVFKKGDVLVEYVCKDLRAEVDIAKSQQEVTQKKSAASYKLFKLDIISDIEKLELESESKQAEARTQLYESRMEDCYIRAEYDGRVVKRLANAGEFTRTDRVLLEVASLDYLKAEFLLPSRWLRWVNVGAPLEITLNETEKTYPARVKFIYGEVDPVSQSIQVTAQLDPYEDPLLPGMSGQTTIDVEAIRRAGIYGFLEQKPEDYRP